MQRCFAAHVSCLLWLAVLLLLGCVLPADLFAGTSLAMKAVVSVLLMGLTFIAARVATRDPLIRVQIDTARGELREVVDGQFGTVHKLVSYGLKGFFHIFYNLCNLVCTMCALCV